MDKGYQKTTISDIAKKMNVAQGMLYYYFKSKDEILESLIHRQSSLFMSTIKELACADTIAPPRKLELITRTLLQGVQYKDGLYLDFLYDDQQLHLKDRISRRCHLFLSPWLLQVIEEGSKQQCFHTAHAKTSLDFILVILDLLIDTMYEKLPDDLLTLRLRMAESLLEKALGAEEKSLHLSL